MSSNMNPATGASDLRERSFQNVVETVLRPSGIKVGGFPEEMFLDLDENDKERLICNICYLVINECRQCDNSHSFCRSCVVAWSLTYGENARKCPFCRCTQDEYHPNKTIDSLIGDKRVRCLEEDCNFRAPVKIFLMHSHGKAAYSNAEVDFEKLKPPPAHMFVLPPFALTSRSGRVTGIREQLLQGRMMIQQMMLLMHLEMQLRQQALVSYQETNEPAIRMQRLDDVMALNEQLNEVGSILSMLLSTPINRVNDREETASRSHDDPPAAAAAAVAPEVNDPMHPSSSDVLSALSSSANALAVNSMLSHHSPLRLSASTGDRPALLSHRRLISATPPRLLSSVVAVPRRQESQNNVATTSLPFSLDTFSDVDDDDDIDDYEDRYIDGDDFLWEESHRFQGLDNSRRHFDFDAPSPRLRQPLEIPPSRDMTARTVTRLTRSDQTDLHGQAENQDELMTTTTASRIVQTPFDQRQTQSLLSRDQEPSLRFSHPEHSGGLSSSTRGFQSGANISPRSELSAQTSLPRLIALPRIQRTPRLVSSVELDEQPDRTAAETIEQPHDRHHLATDASSIVDTSLNLASSVQTSLRNNETTDQQQQQSMASAGSNTALSLPQGTSLSSAASPPALQLPNASSSVLRVLRQQETIDATMQPAIRSSRSRLLRQTSSHPFQNQRTTSRPSLLQRTESQASEVSQEHPALPASSQTNNGHRSTTKLTAVRTSNAPSSSSRPALIQASLTPQQRPTLTQRSSLMQTDGCLLSRSSPANAFPIRRSAIEHQQQQTPVPHPPGTAAAASSARRQSSQAPVAGVGRGMLTRSRRRSEIRQELRKSLRQDDD